MAYVPAKMIQSILKKEGIDVEGYDVINSIEEDSNKEAKRLGMNEGITEQYEFSSQYQIEGVTLIFCGYMAKDYREIREDEEVPYYYIQLDSCIIKKYDEEEKVIDMDVYF